MEHGVKDFRVDGERLLAAHLAALEPRSPAILSVHRTTIQRFLVDFGKPSGAARGRLALEEPQLLQWLIEYARGQSHRFLAARLCVLTGFFQTLSHEEWLDRNLLADFKVRHGTRSWDVIAKALQAQDPEAALAVLRPPPPLRGPLHDAMENYLQLQRSLGKKCHAHARSLRNLDRFLAAASVTSLDGITPQVMERWLAGLTCSFPNRLVQARLVGRFFKYLCSLGLLTGNPMTAVIAGGRLPRTSFKPFIYTKEQLAAILTKAKQLPKTERFPLQPETCYTMIVLLYTLGLRHGEVRRLRIRDVELARRTLFVCQTKFHKSRYVPFGPKVGLCLEEFLHVRPTLLPPVRAEDPVFVSRWRKPISHHALLGVFPKILRELGITGIKGQKQGPRLHDLRHTFAVHRLLQWYREGVDVQNRLPLLSTFMGHVNPRNTEVYLTITDELLREANARFHQHFGYIFDEEACA